MPTREEPHHEIELIKILDHVDGRSAGQKQLSEQRASFLGPRFVWCLAVITKSLEGRASEHFSGASS